ncbi:sensor histidine kinase [Spirosoma soli]|uniref:Sensor histidine kinase n=1 Tax=Spirosoma soli TaxID=1770529 RepID=A0ABW5LXU1_9BACT
MNVLERYQRWLHVIGWVVFVSLPMLTLPDFFRNRQDLISIGASQFISSALIIVCFYINLNSLTPSLLEEQRVQRFWLTLLGMLVSVVLVRMACYYAFPPSFRTHPLPNAFQNGIRLGPRRPWPMLVGSSLSFGFAMLVSSLIALFKHHTRSQAVQQQMILEKVSAELAMLKLQVSPHFLFNTLNNIRWLARQKSEQTEAAVVTLAQLLRYMIYQAQQDKVPLRQEVEHLRHYIDLQKMRLTDIHTVTFIVEGDVDAYHIEPLLFIPFVENAFKYGLHSQQTGHINIWLEVTQDTLKFSVENPISTSGVPADMATQDNLANADSGIGIRNVQKRLTLHYPDKHELSLTDKDNRFRVVLTLHLHHAEIALHRH